MIDVSPEQAAIAALWTAYNMGCLGVITYLSKRLSKCDQREEERNETTRKLAEALQKQVDTYEERERIRAAERRNQ